MTLEKASSGGWFLPPFLAKFGAPSVALDFKQDGKGYCIREEDLSSCTFHVFW